MYARGQLLSLWLVLILAGCNESSSGFSAAEGGLQQAQDCGDVLESIHADAIAKIDFQVRAVEDGTYYGGLGGDGFNGGGGTGGAAPAAPTEDSGAGDGPRGFSDTNRQVADVDEADIVKVGDEGRKLYVIRGNGFYEFDSWPAAETAQAADLQIEGSPIEMFVADGRAVVFSAVYDIRALDDGNLCGSGGFDPRLVDVPEGGLTCGRSFVKITVVALESEGPRTVREVYVDGFYTSSRRHDDMVRAVVQTHLHQPPSVPELWEYYNDRQYETRQEQIAIVREWARAAKEAIRETSLEQWVPVWGERVDGELVEREVQCEDFYSPAPGITDYGLTQIVGIDSTKDDPIRIASILGWASVVYSNRASLVLTQPDWSWATRGTESDRTAVHRFTVSFDEERTRYQGSGFVPGIVDDQFSIDERDGVIRIATTRTTWRQNQASDVWVPPVTHNFVSAMRLNEGTLQVVGSTPPLAEGERIFSARFLGDLGYIVTFRQVDPLFAIDLSNPEELEVLGELKIPGFSDYMHPLGPDHLLTIGRDIDENTLVDNGTALQIFDVSNPADPVLAHKELVGSGFSAANHNHKAFNFYADGDDDGLLAFPFVSYESAVSSTLELWSVDAETGMSRLGAVDHSSLITNDCQDWMPPIGVPFEPWFFEQSCGYEPQISRGVFIDDYIYSISHGGVMVHDVGDLTTPIATAGY